MARTWKLIWLSTLLTAMLTAGAGRADPPTGSTDKPDEVKKQLTDLTNAVNKLRDEIKELRSDANNNRTEFDQHKQGIERELKTINTDIARLKSDVEGLRSGSASRQAGYAPSTPPLPPPAGRVELVNTWPGDVSVVVNNRSYRLRPNDRVVTDPLPAGPFSYEVIGVTEPNRVRLLAANQTYTILIHP
jgi:outer membrane murein-binding lipoprotein Lpp